MICSILISITNNMFSKWEGGVGRRRWEFVDFAMVLVNFGKFASWDIEFESCHLNFNNFNASRV